MNSIERRKKDVAKYRLKKRGFTSSQITPEMLREETDAVKNIRHKGRTRPPGYEDVRYCYYYLEDGECSLDNPVIWKRLQTYIYRLIRYTHWIYKKNFTEAEDILSEVKAELDASGLLPIQYGAAEGVDAITFLITKINTQTGREWWKYLKVMEPSTFAFLKEQQRLPRKTDQAIKNVRNYNRSTMRQLRESLDDLYLLQLIYSDLKNQTAMRYSFEEIRRDFPHLIVAKREKIIKLREKKNKK